MAFPANAFVITFRFDLLLGDTPADIAEFGVWMLPDDAVGDWNAFLVDQAHSGYDAWQLGADAAWFTNAVRLGRVDATHVDADGSVLHQQSFVAPDPWRGGGDDPSLPWETALVISLYSYTPGTFIPNGRRRRGRNYLPPFASNLLDTLNSGFIATDIQTDIADGMKIFYDSIGIVVPDRLASPQVMSRVDVHGYVLTDITVDIEIDSQRRRQNRVTAPRVRRELAL